MEKQEIKKELLLAYHLNGCEDVDSAFNDVQEDLVSMQEKATEEEVNEAHQELLKMDYERFKYAVHNCSYPVGQACSMINKSSGAEVEALSYREVIHRLIQIPEEHLDDRFQLIIDCDDSYGIYTGSEMGTAQDLWETPQDETDWPVQIDDGTTINKDDYLIEL